MTDVPRLFLVRGDSGRGGPQPLAWSAFGAGGETQTAAGQRKPCRRAWRGQSRHDRHDHCGRGSRVLRLPRASCRERSAHRVAQRFGRVDPEPLAGGTECGEEADERHQHHHGKQRRHCVS